MCLDAVELNAKEVKVRRVREAVSSEHLVDGPIELGFTKGQPVVVQVIIGVYQSGLFIHHGLQNVVQQSASDSRSLMHEDERVCAITNGYLQFWCTEVCSGH